MIILSFNELSLVSGAASDCYCEFVVPEELLPGDNSRKSAVEFSTKEKCFNACKSFICGEFKGVGGIRWAATYEVTENGKKESYQESGSCFGVHNT